MANATPIENLGEGFRGARENAASQGHRPSAIALLANPESSPLPLLVAADILFGPGWIVWEPESVYMEYKDLARKQMPAENRDRLMGALAVTLNPAFFWDSQPFQNFVMIANKEDSLPDALQEPTPPELLWGLVLADLLWEYGNGEDGKPRWDDEICQFCAVVLNRNGIRLAAGPLEFCQPHLDMLFHGCQGPALERVQKAWAELPKEEGALQKHEFKEDPLSVQLHHLAVMYIHAQTEARDAAKQLFELFRPADRP